MNVKAYFLCLLFLFSPISRAELEYHGFHIDDHLLDHEQRELFSSQAFASVESQLDIVESVGVPQEVLQFFKGVRIQVDPALQGNPAFFSVRDGKGIVRIRPIVFAANRPIFLHELLHAYHSAVLTTKNIDVLNAYNAAKCGNFYSDEFQQTHFLSNEKEFFAVTGTIYLFGRILQPPFNCEVLAESEPDYLAFLEKTFGRHNCE